MLHKPMKLPHSVGGLSFSTLILTSTLLISVSAPGAFVQNPSFESNYNPTWPHYLQPPFGSGIDSWTATGNCGVDDRSFDVNSAFHDNGKTPDRDRVGFTQQNGDLSQEIFGLIPGATYWIQFYYNTRGNVQSGNCDITTRFAGVDLDTIAGVQRVEASGSATLPFPGRSVPFMAQSDSGTLTFHFVTEGDRSSVIDAVTIVERGPDDVVIMNPSFEASGILPAVGAVPILAGWAGTGVVGVDTAGGAYADNGLIPDQDLVGFIEGPGALEQTIKNLVPNTQYTLAFAYNARVGNLPHLRVSAGTATIFEADVTAVGGAGVYHTNVTTFTATSDTLALKLEQTKVGTDALFFDNVRLLGQTATVLPPVQIAPGRSELAPGQSVTISVKVPEEKIALGDADLRLASSDTNIVRLLGAAPDGGVTLHYIKNGATAQTLEAIAIERGTASVNVTESAGLIVTNSVLIQVVESFVRNPSFEAEKAPGGIGVGSILAWSSTGTAGINTIDQPFAGGSGTIPDRQQVAFVQGVGAISQNVTGLTPGGTYWLQFRYSLREIVDPAGPALDLTVKLGEATVVSIPNVIPLSQAGLSAYYATNVVFAPTEVAGALQFITTNVKGDATLLLDAVTIVRRSAEDIVLQNPSFEASGGMELYVNGPMAGWTFTAAGHGTDFDGPFADNGIVPDQDQALFLQGGDSVEQTVSGLNISQQYTLVYSVNTRGCCPDSSVTTHYLAQIGIPGAPATVLEEDLGVVGPDRLYNRRAVVFTADWTDQVIRFQHVPPGDRTLLLDDIRLVVGAVGDAPVLSMVAQLDGSARISWPSSAVGYQPQSAPSLDGPWINDPAAVSVEGNQKSIKVQPNSAARFYRLSL